MPPGLGTSSAAPAFDRFLTEQSIAPPPNSTMTLSKRDDEEWLAYLSTAGQFSPCDRGLPSWLRCFLRDVFLIASALLRVKGNRPASKALDFLVGAVAIGDGVLGPTSGGFVSIDPVRLLAIAVFHLMTKKW
jgi:hypothetical protein